MKKAMTMKTWAAVLACAVMLAAMWAVGAMAEDARGVIFAEEAGGEVAMREAADEDSAVLMHYYDGTLVTVLGEEGDWTRIRVGTERASLTGYVPTGVVRGVEAQRERAAMLHVVGVELVKAYAAPDEGAQVLHQETIEGGMSVSICGYNDEWVQRASDGRTKCDQWAGGPDEGFLRRMGAQIYKQGAVTLVQPLEGEMKHEQAYDLAIQYAVENPEWLDRFDEDERNEESLRAMWWDVFLIYDTETEETHWQVFIQKDGVEYEKNICIEMDADGKLMDMESGNG